MGAEREWQTSCSCKCTDKRWLCSTNTKHVAIYVHRHMNKLMHICFCNTELVANNPRGYKNTQHVPVLHGLNACGECLCAPCVIVAPPSYLKGSCGPHPANDNKSWELYNIFWGTLKDLGLWKAEEYLRKKTESSRVADRREIIPKCIIQVTMCLVWITHIIMHSNRTGSQEEIP